MPQVRKVASLRRLFHFLLRARFQTDSHGRRDDGGVLLVGGGQVAHTAVGRTGVGAAAHRLGSGTQRHARIGGQPRYQPAAEVLKEYNTSSNISTTQRGVKSSFFTLAVPCQDSPIELFMLLVAPLGLGQGSRTRELPAVKSKPSPPPQSPATYVRAAGGAGLYYLLMLMNRWFVAKARGEGAHAACCT